MSREVPGLHESTSPLREYFVVAQSGPAPHFADVSEHFVHARNPDDAIERAKEDYRHPAGLAHAAVYPDANAYYKDPLKHLYSVRLLLFREHERLNILDSNDLANGKQYRRDSVTPLHESTFLYLKPSDEQKAQMAVVRHATREYADTLIAALPSGPDKTYVLRKLREIGMWANVAITREADGTPRPGAEV